MSQPLIKIRSLTKRYGRITALEDCTLDIPRGEIFGLLGPNGSGKTTLLRLMLGFLRPTSGCTTIDGLDCHRQRVAAHRRLTYMPGEARLFRTMRGQSVLKFFSQVRPDGDWENGQRIAKRLDLDLTRWVGFMSTGMRQKLALAIALSPRSPLVILDEPTSNLDPNVRHEVLRMVSEARDEGRTVVFSSHVLTEVEEVCDRVGILRAGRLVHVQCLAQLKRQHRIQAWATGPLPPLPADLQSGVTRLDQTNGRLLIETPVELAPLLAWLAQAPLRDVRVEPVGLRAVYDRFHFANMAESAEEDE